MLIEWFLLAVGAEIDSVSGFRSGTYSGQQTSETSDDIDASDEVTFERRRKPVPAFY